MRPARREQSPLRALFVALVTVGSVFWLIAAGLWGGDNPRGADWAVQFVVALVGITSSWGSYVTNERSMNRLTVILGAIALALFLAWLALTRHA